MNKKIISIAAFIMLLVFLLATMTVLTNAGTPSEPHDADAVWLEPKTMSLTAVGQTFNVTVGVNMTEDVFGWQIALLYNRTYLKCTTAKYSDGATSNLFAGHTTSSVSFVIDVGLLGNGSVLGYESLLGDDFVPGPCSGTLMYATFQVVSSPATPQNLTFDITTQYPKNTWVRDPTTAKITLTTYNATYTIPEFQTLLLLSVLMGSTILAAAISKRKRPIR